MKGIVYMNYLTYQYNIKIYSFIEEKAKLIQDKNNYFDLD